MRTYPAAVRSDGSVGPTALGRLAELPLPVLVLGAVVLLAALDLAGTWAAKASVQHRSLEFVVLGMGAWVLAFGVYVWALEIADLTPVTLGWIVVLQVGVVLLDRFHYGTSLPVGWPVVVALLLAGEAYLLLGPVPAGP